MDLQSLDTYAFQINCASLVGNLSEKLREELLREEGTEADLELTKEENSHEKVEFDEDAGGS